MPRPRGGSRRAARCLLLITLVVLAVWPDAAAALVERPVTVDGPSADIAAVGGAALAADGSGGIVYLKRDEGTLHVFAVRRLRRGYSAPVRVDALPYEASQPAIAASERGRLLVVWVSQIGTVHGAVRRALYSAELGPGASSFGEPLVVDPNVGDGRNVEPSLAGTAPDRAIVAYRVITKDFSIVSPVDPVVPLRPGDVLADVRVARYQGTRWLRLGAINRNPEASVPAPNAANAPRVGLADDGGAVVAWQERDQSIAARIWARRVFTASLGPILLASPASFDGKQMSADADALALAVSPLGMAEVVSRVPGGPGVPTRVYANRLPSTFDEGAGAFEGPRAADGGPLGGVVGPPAVAVADQGDGSAHVAFALGAGLRTSTLGEARAIGSAAPGPPPLPGGEVAIGETESGANVISWVTTGADGLPAVAVRQEGADGAAQAGVLAGAFAGQVSDLSMATNPGGDALISFLQRSGERGQVVAEGVSAAPARFALFAPPRWVKPGGARLHWDQAESTSPPITYTVFLDGEPVGHRLRRALIPLAALLGNGIRRARVLATDAQGQTAITRPVRLRVDARAPRASASSSRRGLHAVAVKVLDPESGVDAKRTSCNFGDGTRARGKSCLRHRYPRAGHYLIRLRTRDRAGNATTLRLAVRAR